MASKVRFPISRRIIDEYLVQRFRESNFYGGIEEATGALVKLVDGESPPEPYHAPVARRALEPRPFLFIVFWITMALNGVLGPLPAWIRSPVVGTGVAFATWWLGAGLAILAAFASAAFSLLMRGSGRYVGRGGSTR